MYDSGVVLDELTHGLSSVAAVGRRKLVGGDVAVMLQYCELIIILINHTYTFGRI